MTVRQLFKRASAGRARVLGGLFLSTALMTGAISLSEESNTPTTPPVFSLSQKPGYTTQAPVPQENSLRTYRTLKLENGLEVLLINDPTTSTTATTLSVKTGSLYDPDDKQGLAHYLEHMIFQGTKKYPEPGSFEKFLSAHGGSRNATTTHSYTNYYFDISTESLDESLDRFSSLFISPLFDKTRAAQELLAVHSEFDKDLKDDSSRVWNLVQQLSEKDHPFNKFMAGNKNSLKGDNQEALRIFFKKYYAASNMKFAMISALSLDEQEALIVRHFSALPDFHVDHPVINSDYRKPLKDQYRLLFIEGVNTEKTLTLDFPTINLNNHNDSGPVGIIRNIIVNQSPGSLYAHLQAEGLATAIDLGLNSPHPAMNSVNVSVTLTDKGIANYENVMELFFSYIKLLKEKDIERYTFEEAQKQSNVGLKWGGTETGTNYTTSMAEIMHGYPLDKIFIQPYTFEKFDPDAYRKVLDTITPANMLVILKGATLEQADIDPLFGTKYLFVHVAEEPYKKLSAASVRETMKYPQPNPYISDTLSLKPPVGLRAYAEEERPHLVIDNNLGTVWALFDTHFKKPQGYISLHMGTPYVADKPENFVKATMLQACIDQYMSDKIAPLAAAGMSYSTELREDGIILNFGGYTTPHLPAFIETVSAGLTGCRITEAEFDHLKQTFLETWQGELIDGASLSREYMSSLISRKEFTKAEKAEALENLTLQDIHNYGQRIWRHVRITGMAYGNLYDKDVRNAVAIVLRHTKSQPLPPAAQTAPLTPRLLPGEKAVASFQSTGNNNVLNYALYAGPLDQKRWAALAVLERATSADFYNNIRNTRQTGYVAQTYKNIQEDHMYVGYIVQSANYGPAEIQRRVESWMKGVPDLLQKLSDDEFETIKRNLAAQNTDRGGDMTSYLNYWFELVHDNNANFNYFDETADYIRKLTRQDVLDMAHELITLNRHGCVIVQVRAQDSKEIVFKGNYTDINHFKYRISLRGIPSPYVPGLN